MKEFRRGSYAKYHLDNIPQKDKIGNLDEEHHGWIETNVELISLPRNVS